jgi:hypothetical protein
MSLLELLCQVDDFWLGSAAAWERDLLDSGLKAIYPNCSPDNRVNAVSPSSPSSNPTKHIASKL